MYQRDGAGDVHVYLGAGFGIVQRSHTLTSSGSHRDTGLSLYWGFMNDLIAENSCTIRAYMAVISQSVIMMHCSLHPCLALPIQVVVAVMMVRESLSVNVLQYDDADDLLTRMLSHCAGKRFTT